MLIGAGGFVALHLFARPGIDLEGDSRLRRDLLDGANVLLVEIHLALAVQRLGDGAAAKHETLRAGADAFARRWRPARTTCTTSATDFTGALKVKSRDNFIWRAFSLMSQNLHSSLRSPVLAVAKNRDEGAEGDDLMIGRAVGQVLE